MSCLLSKLKAWKRAIGSNKTVLPENNEVDEAVDLVLNMAKLLRIDPQQIVDGMQERITVKEVITIDHDIDAVVKKDTAEVRFLHAQ